MATLSAPTGHLYTLTRIQWPMMPPFITAQSITVASFGAENNPLDLTLGKLAGIGVVGDPPAPRVTAASDFDFEVRFAVILPSIKMGPFKASGCHRL
jgi:hypothetical protein